jgi:ABC-type multidrug transport system ATPase subunit
MTNFDEFVLRRLDEVGLKDSGNLAVGKYSGGMRRRISLALSTMGNPNTILMDEPTTGMDPVSRRHAWSLIQSLKKDKAIIMSTHAMEEAELLSDKVIVLNHGEVKCVGTPQQLKNMFGDGYRISMICDKSNISQVRSLMKVLVPGSVFLESSGNSGGMVFTIPMSKIHELGPIFIIMEGSSKVPDDLKLTENQKKAMLSL